MKKINFLLILFVLGTLSINMFAQKNKPKNSDTVVTTTFQDIDLTTSLYHTMRSDAGGAYVNGTASVASAIQGIGDWDFDLLNSSTRRVFFDFGSSTGTNIDGIAPPSSGAYSARFLSQCSVRPGKRLQDLRISDGTIYCPLNVRIQVGSEEYSLRFRTVEFPGSNDVAWTCASEANSKCNGWRMESASGGSLARLLKITTAKGKTTTKSGSLYYFTFKVDLTTP
jgi:hypothetical protein